MDRCAEHGLLNCKCAEPLSKFLARQFSESPHDRVDRGSRRGGRPGDVDAAADRVVAPDETSTGGLAR